MGQRVFLTEELFGSFLNFCFCYFFIFFFSFSFYLHRKFAKAFRIIKIVGQMEDTGSTATKEKKGCCKIDNVWLFEKIAGDFDDIDSQA